MSKKPLERLVRLTERPKIDPRALPRECVLILTPIGRDAEYSRLVLSRAGLHPQTCFDLTGLCDLVTDDIGVLLIAEEALTNNAPQLIERLNKQAPWSDIPIVIFTSGGETSEASARVLRLFEKSGNVTLLERPVHTLTLISAVQVALRARRRQWQIRELLEQREQLLQEARAAREDAEEANRMKDQFLATLSHELRTPLNAIMGWTQVLSAEDVSDDDVRVGIQTIERNARTQAQLIEDLLDISRIVSGKLRLDLQVCDVPEVLYAAVSSVAPAAKSRGVDVQVRLQRPMPRMLLDPARLQQIVWNLLSNAVKFTARGGRVELTAESDHTTLTIAVSDNGIGIDPSFLPYVFDRFRQADGSTTRRQGGLGLGLSIVKQLVEMHGGSIEVSSNGVSLGSRFEVRLPVQLTGESRRESITTTGQPVAASNAATSNSVNLEALTSTDGEFVDAHSDIHKRDLSGLNILVVDDEADARTILHRLLTDRKAMVRVAASVTHALDLIDQAKPDVIISDISMPDQDGFDLLREIRTDGHDARDVPVIALTAYARSEDRDRILKAGFTAHLAKPVSAPELVAVIHSSSKE